MKLEVVRLEGRTPLLFIEVPPTPGAENAGTVLLYGHLDKQPEMTGWADGLGPWTPVIREGRLYGRGGADDGYAVFASIAALRALREDGRAHARCAIVIECCEESGSYDLPAYLEALAPRIGTPDLVIGLDSGCGNYEQLWGTTSLRGLVNGVLTVEVLTEGVHSGDASGVVASSFRIARLLLDRIDDAATGVVKHAAFHAPIPRERIDQAQARRGRARAGDPREVSVRAGHAADGGIAGGAGPEPHVAPDARRHRRGRFAAARQRGQRSASENGARRSRCEFRPRWTGGRRPGSSRRFWRPIRRTARR